MKDIIFTNLTNISLMIAIAAILISFFVLSYVIFKRKTDKDGSKLDEFYLKIREDIKFSVAPKFIELSPNVSNLVDLAIEVWRIEQRVNRSLSLLPEHHHSGLTNSIHKLKRYLDKCDIEIREHTGQKFNDGLNLDVLSVEKDPSQHEPIVKETIEPTIICKGQVINKAKIILLSN